MFYILLRLACWHSLDMNLSKTNAPPLSLSLCLGLAQSQSLGISCFSLVSRFDCQSLSRIDYHRLFPKTSLSHTRQDTLSLTHLHTGHSIQHTYTYIFSDTSSLTQTCTNIYTQQQSWTQTRRHTETRTDSRTQIYTPRHTHPTNTRNTN